MGVVPPVQGRVILYGMVLRMFGTFLSLERELPSMVLSTVPSMGMVFLPMGSGPSLGMCPMEVGIERPATRKGGWRVCAIGHSWCLCALYREKPWGR